MAEDGRSELFVQVNVALIVISTVIVAARAYIRSIHLRNWGLDDTLACLAWASQVTVSVLEIKLAAYGAGKHIYTLSFEVLKKYFQIFYPIGSIYFLAVGLTRLSVAAFIPRISQDKGIKVATWLIAGVVSVWTLFCILLTTFQCKPIRYSRETVQTVLSFQVCSASWDITLKPIAHCIAISPLYTTSAALGVACDLALLFIPMYIIRQNMVMSKTLLKAMLVFGVASVSCVMGIVRMAMIIHVQLGSDITYNFTYIAIWSLLEAHVGLWAASFPALQPLLRFITAAIDSTNGSRSDLRSQAASGKQQTVGSGGGASAWSFRSTKKKGGSVSNWDSTVQDDRVGSENTFLEGGLMIRMGSMVEQMDGGGLWGVRRPSHASKNESENGRRASASITNPRNMPSDIV